MSICLAMTISREDFEFVFPVASVNVGRHTVADWSIALGWLRSFKIGEVPSSQVKIALRSLVNYESQLLELFIERMRGTFKEVVSGQLEYRGSEYIDLPSTVRIIETIVSVKMQYYLMLQYMEVDQKSVTLEGAFNAMCRQALGLDYMGDREKRQRFVENLKYLVAPSLYNDAKFLELQRWLAALCDTGIVEEVEYVVAVVTKQYIQEYVWRTFARKWDQLVLPQIPGFLEVEVYPKLAECCKLLKDSTVTYDLMLRDLELVVRDELVKLRILELLEIVQQYPRSICALEELKTCLTTPGQRNYLIDKFGRAVDQGMLHPGVNTVDIISFYISMIRSLLIIDPRGVILDKVGRPTRKYLRDKSDTVKYIVKGLLDNNPDSELYALAEQLRASSNLYRETQPDELVWVPDPIDALPDFKRSKVGDIIESAISLFDSKDHFFGEFFKYFSQQLIDAENYNIEVIVAKLLLLKQKFGSSSEFDSLDVMVHDVIESQEIDQKIHHRSEPGASFDKYHSTIVSYLFWPNDLIGERKVVDFKLPAEVQAHFDRYAQGYSAIKQGRKIEPLELGKVNLDLELKDRRLKFVVLPLLASVILLFDDNSLGLTVQEVGEKLEMNELKSLKSLNYWQKQGILELKNGKYYVLEEEKKLRNYQDEDLGEEKDTDRFSRMGAYLPFIKGMLTNLGSMNVQKIQGFLQMVVPKGLNLSCSEKELEEYLKFLVEEEILELAGGMYKLI